MSVPNRFGSEFTLGASVANEQADVSLARGIDGRVVAAWSDLGLGSGDVRRSIMNANGSVAVAEAAVATGTAGQQRAPVALALETGAHVIAWEDFAADASGDVRFRVFNASGVAPIGDLTAQGGTGIQQRPTGVGRADGSFVLGWMDTAAANTGLGAGSSAAMARAFDSSGTALGALPTRISGNFGGDFAPEMAARGNDLAFFWDDDGGPDTNGLNNDGLYSRLVSGALPVPLAAGSQPWADGGTRIDDGPFREASRNNDLAFATVNGVATRVMVWDDVTSSSDGRDIFVRTQTASGLSAVTRVNTTTAGSQEFAAVAGLALGGFVVVWTDGSAAGGSDIRARYYTPLGVASSDDFVVTQGSFSTGAQIGADVVALLDGRFMVAWGTGADNTRSIEGQIFDARTGAMNWMGWEDAMGAPVGRDEQFWGTDLSVQGDTLWGLMGNDWLVGQAGDDLLRGSGSSDSLEGGVGFDTLYGDDLLTEAGYGFYTGNDTLRGGADADRLWASPGNNVYDGGSGQDWLSYNIEWVGYSEYGGRLVSLTIDLSTNSAVGLYDYEDPFTPFVGEILRDTITDIEVVFGSFIGDTIIGDALRNDLQGGNGNDFLQGGGGNDALSGDQGNDTVAGGAGDDMLYGNAAEDTFRWSGARADHHVFISPSGFERRLTVRDEVGAGGTDTAFDDAFTIQFSNGGYSEQLYGMFQNKRANMDGLRFDDIVVRNTTTGQTGFIDFAAAGGVGFQSILGAMPAGWIARGSGDLTGDGRADLLVQNTANGATYYYNQAAGAWGTVTASVTSAWEAVGLSDMNSDFVLDVVMRDSTSGALVAAIMNGSGGFGSWSSLGNLGTGWRMAGTGDLDRDGSSDLVFQNTANGVTYFADWNATTFNGWGFVAGPVGASWVARATGDLNRDGFTDVVFQNTSTGDIWWVNMANGTNSGWNVITNGAIGWTVRGTADLDNDGWHDVVIQNAAGLVYWANMDAGGFSGWGVAGNMGGNWVAV